MKRNWKKDTVLFIISQTLSLFGSSLVMYAIMWYITLETKSGVMMAIYIVCGFLPTFFLSPFAGVWADRYDRKKLIMLSDSFIAVTTLILAIVFLLGYHPVYALFIASAFRALGTSVQTPAVGAFIPQIVPEEQLTRVNGINSSVQAAIMLISPMLSAALLTFSTIETILFIDVITAAIAVLVLLIFLKVPAHAKAQSPQVTSYFNDLREGVLYIRNHGFLKQFFLFCVVFFFLVTPAAFLTPLQVTRSFGSDVWRLTAVEISFSIGAILGGIIMASWGGFKNRVHTMALSSIAVSLGTIALGVVSVFWIYIGIMGVWGIFMPMFNTPSTVLLQEKVEEAYLGRVFGVMGMISSSMMPLGMLVFGPVADIIAIEWLLIGTGFLLLILSFFLIYSKDLLAAGQPVTAPERS